MDGSKSTALAQAFPFLDLRAQYRTIKAEVDEAVDRVMQSQHFILGPEVESFEREIAAYCGCKFAVACASGSDALLLSLMALGVSTDDEVITTPFTFVATGGAIARLGARPVFVDIDRTTYNLDPEKLTSAITSKTRAIIPVYLFGLAADLDPILQVANPRRVPIIEDAAQAVGASYHNRRVGTFGLCGCLSFFPSKNLGGAGDGGMLTSDDASFVDRLQILRNHGGHSKYKYEVIGMNSRLDALQAAILRVKLKHLDSWSEGRRQNVARYAKLFRDCGLQEVLTFPVDPPRSRHIYNQYVIRAPLRDELKEFLRDRGIPTEVYYPAPLHLEPAFGYLGYHAGDLPVAEAACREVLALPVFPEITVQQQRQVVESIWEFYQPESN